MAFCVKITVNNTYNIPCTISYNRCSDNQFIDEYVIPVGQKRVFWAFNGTFTSAQLPFLEITTDIFPPIPTPSSTPSYSSTPTPTPTSTVTPSPTSGLTTTPTATATVTPTPSPSSGTTQTPTATATVTPTPSPSSGTTQTPTATATVTPTPSTTSGTTQTPTATATLTPTPSPSSGTTQTPTATATLTPTPSTTSGTTQTPTATATLTPTPSPSSGTTQTPTATATVTPTPSTTSGTTQTPTPSETPTNTPTPSVTPEPVTGYSFNLVALPYNFPSSGNTIMNNNPLTSGSTNPNLLETNSRGIYWNSIDSDGIDRTSYFSAFTGQSITITMSQTGSTAIYSGDTNSLKRWVTTGDTGFVFGTMIGVPPENTPSGNAILIQSASTEWTIGLPVYISVVVNGDVTPTPTPTSTETPTITPTPTVSESNTPTPTVTETPTNTPTPTVSESNTPTPTPTTTDLSSVTTFTISGCTNLNVLVVDLGPSVLAPGDVFNLTFTGGTPSGCYRIVEKTVATPADGATPLLFYVNCAACEATLVTPTPTPTPTVTETPSETPTPTVTPTPTISETPTNTPTNTPTPTVTPTNTPTPSITPSPQPPNPSLILDFDASVATNFTPTASEGVESSYWNNLVVGGLPFTGSSAFNSPIWETLPSYNNLGSLEFGSGKRLWTNLQNNFESATGYTLFYVFNTTSISTLQFALNTTTTNPSSGNGYINAIFDTDGTLQISYIDSSIARRYSWGTTDVRLLTVIYDGSLTSAQRLKVRIDGVDATPSTSSGNWPSSLNSFYGLSLSSPGGAFPLLGNVGALKLYNSAIGASEITSVENELMVKFDI